MQVSTSYTSKRLVVALISDPSSIKKGETSVVPGLQLLDDIRITHVGFTYTHDIVYTRAYSLRRFLHNLELFLHIPLGPASL